MSTSTPPPSLSTPTFTSTSRPPLPLTPQTSAAYFQSSRLLYRAVEESDSAFIHRVESDPTDSLFANGGVQKPKGLKRTDEQRDWLMCKDVILGVVVCLLPEPSAAVSSTNAGSDAAAKETPAPVPVPIGTLSLHSCYGPPHRGGILGISILSDYRGKGYGAEALRWITTWGFRAANLHRIQVDYFSWNQDAGKLYRKLGFRQEGHKRECFWFNGGWGDEFTLAVLAKEWEALEAERDKSGGQ